MVVGGKRCRNEMCGHLEEEHHRNEVSGVVSLCTILNCPCALYLPPDEPKVKGKPGARQFRKVEGRVRHGMARVINTENLELTPREIFYLITAVRKDRPVENIFCPMQDMTYEKFFGHEHTALQGKLDRLAEELRRQWREELERLAEKPALAAVPPVVMGPVAG